VIFALKVAFDYLQNLVTTANVLLREKFGFVNWTKEGNLIKIQN